MHCRHVHGAIVDGIWRNIRTSNEIRFPLLATDGDVWRHGNAANTLRNIRLTVPFDRGLIWRFMSPNWIWSLCRIICRVTGTGLDPVAVEHFDYHPLVTRMVALCSSSDTVSAAKAITMPPCPERVVGENTGQQNTEAELTSSQYPRPGIMTQFTHAGPHLTSYWRQDALPIAH